MSATVVSVTPFHWGHTSVVLSDGSTRLFMRGETVPSVGDPWPAPELRDPNEPANSVLPELSEYL